MAKSKEEPHLWFQQSSV